MYADVTASQMASASTEDMVGSKWGIVNSGESQRALPEGSSKRVTRFSNLRVAAVNSSRRVGEERDSRRDDVSLVCWSPRIPLAALLRWSSNENLTRSSSALELHSVVQVELTVQTRHDNSLAVKYIWYLDPLM